MDEKNEFPWRYKGDLNRGGPEGIDIHKHIQFCILLAESQIYLRYFWIQPEMTMSDFIKYIFVSSEELKTYLGLSYSNGKVNIK